MPPDLTAVSSALALRLRHVARLLDRLDRLESGSGAWLSGLESEALGAAASEITLRALRTAADPTTYQLLAYLTRHTSLPVADLEAATGLDRLTLSERVNDLVQVGLAGRNIDTNHVQITEAGAALAGLIESIAGEIVRQLTAAPGPGAG